MDLIRYNDKKFEIIFSNNDLDIIRSAIIEVLYALDEHDIQTRTGFLISDFDRVLNDINKIESCNRNDSN